MRVRRCTQFSFACLAASAVALALAVVGVGRGDTGSPPPPSLGAVEGAAASKQFAAHFRRVVMPGYLAWRASTGSPDNLANFTLYLMRLRCSDLERAGYVRLYLEGR